VDCSGIGVDFHGWFDIFLSGQGRIHSYVGEPQKLMKKHQENVEKIDRNNNFQR
jgi:hypothetical protein